MSRCPPRRPFRFVLFPFRRRDLVFEHDPIDPISIVNRLAWEKARRGGEGDVLVPRESEESLVFRLYRWLEW